MKFRNRHYLTDIGLDFLLIRSVASGFFITKKLLLLFGDKNYISCPKLKVCVREVLQSYHRLVKMNVALNYKIGNRAESYKLRSIKNIS